MLIDEFGIIWDKQAEYYPGILTAELKEKVADELFFQRAITSPPPGKCPYFPDEDRLPRLSRLFQQRRIYEECNHLRISDKSGRAHELTLDERDLLVEHLMTGEDLNITAIKKLLELGPSHKVSLENVETRTGIKGYPFDKILGDEAVMGPRWNETGDETRDAILGILARVHDHGKALRQIMPLVGGDQNLARRIVAADMPSGWGHMGRTATIKILEKLKESVVPARIAEDEAGLVHAMTADGVVYDRLPYYGEILKSYTTAPIWVSDYRRETDTPPDTNANEQKYGRIANPVVHMALNQIRKTVNAVIKKYGCPESIHIELARELNKSAKARKEIELKNAENKKASDEAATEIRKTKDRNVAVNPKNIQKYKLWKQQGGECVYTGQTISIQQLYNGEFEVDHILPRSRTFSDDLSNKAVCDIKANADKSNRAPYDAFSHDSKYDWEAIVRRAEKLPDNKSWRFESDAMERYLEDEDGFRARYGMDNSYIARVTRQYLSCLYREPQHTVAVSSKIVSMLRGKWGLMGILGSKSSGKKSRNDHRHHFIDAMVTAFATRAIIKRIMDEAKRTERENLDVFIEKIAPPIVDDIDFFQACKQATLERVQMSRKPEHSTSGQLHEDTLMGIVDGPDKNGSYICRKRKQLKDYPKLSALNKVTIQNTLPDLPEIVKARADLQSLKTTMEKLCVRAKTQLEHELLEKPKQGKKVKEPTENAIFSRARKLHNDENGNNKLILFEKNKLVNVRYDTDDTGERKAVAGFIGGRNHRKDFYFDGKGKLRWQLISMLQANDNNFIPECRKPGNRLLWSGHKEDVLLINNPDDVSEKIRVVVAKMSEAKLGVVPLFDARMASHENPEEKRKMWENGLKFFIEHQAQRIVTNELGDIVYRFPVLTKTLEPGAGS